MYNRGWTGFDLDGTLAVSTTWKGHGHIGEPVPEMITLVKQKLAEGNTIKIFTARVCSQQTPEDLDIAIQSIQTWCLLHIGQILDITAEKDWDMIEYYDDRAIGVDYNTGRLITNEH